LALAVVDDGEVAVGSARLSSKLTVVRVGSVIAATDRVVVGVAVFITDARGLTVLVQLTVSAKRTSYIRALSTYTRHKT